MNSNSCTSIYSSCFNVSLIVYGPTTRESHYFPIGKQEQYNKDIGTIHQTRIKIQIFQQTKLQAPSWTLAPPTRPSERRPREVRGSDRTHWEGVPDRPGLLRARQWACRVGAVAIASLVLVLRKRRVFVCLALLNVLFLYSMFFKGSSANRSFWFATGDLDGVWTFVLFEDTSVWINEKIVWLCLSNTWVSMSVIWGLGRRVCKEKRHLAWFGESYITLARGVLNMTQLDCSNNGP